MISAAGEHVLKPVGPAAFGISQDEGSWERVSVLVAPGQSEGKP